MKLNLPKIFSPSAGVTYHGRAFINKKRWQPFCDYIEEWLIEWLRLGVDLKKTPCLVLIGPNAGYTLPRAFIEQFQKVTVVEPDPLGFLLFESRFYRQAKWVKTDYFGLSLEPPNPEKLLDLFRLNENSLFLFCNVIGQLPVILRDKKMNNKIVDVEAYMNDLKKVFFEISKYYSFASYHDRYSRNLNHPNEWVDHLTGSVFSFCTDRKEFPWQITRRVEHQIEFVRSTPISR